MAVHNADIAAIFEEIANLLEIEGANPFRVRAYRNAGRTISELPGDVARMLERGADPKSLPGIGDDLATKIREIVDTGKCVALERLHREVPSTVAELLRLPGLGPKRVRALYRDLEVHTLPQLIRAAQDGRIRALPGFGPKTENAILQAAQAQSTHSRRLKLSVAAQYALPLAECLRAVTGVTRVEVAGSFRRMKDTVGDLDIVAAADPAQPVMNAFTEYEDVREVLSRGATRSSVLLNNGLQVDLRVVPIDSLGAALLYFTGSKAHNIATRKLAQSRGLKFNEYGAFKGRRRVAGETEESMYAVLGLPWIPPELREDRGELEAANDARLPRLVELKDLCGDLHAHSKASDGHNTIREMALAAKQLGLQYIAITEHSRRLTVAHGLDSVRLEKQGGEIDRLNKTLPGVTVLKGIEVDILEDGDLDLPGPVLSRLDVVVAAVHSKFDLSRARQTERIVRAIENRVVHILAHPTGRLIDQRAPYDVDMARIIRAAAKNGVALELNAHPERLDLLDTQCRMARDEGVPVAVNSDAHSTFELQQIYFGIGQARRGWLERKHVLNTRELATLRRWLRQRK